MTQTDPFDPDLAPDLVRDPDDPDQVNAPDLPQNPDEPQE